MSQFSELIRRIKQAGKLHTRSVLAGKDASSTYKKWASLALKAAKKSERPIELAEIRMAAPSGSEAEKLAESKLEEMKKKWGDNNRADPLVLEGRF